MYNGVGILSVRGSGTSGYVQGNKFNIRSRAPQSSFERDDDAGPVQRKPDEGILQHNRQRDIELQLLVLAEQLEEQGKPSDEIDARVDALRQQLAEQQRLGAQEERRKDETHEQAKRKLDQMENLASVFQINKRAVRKDAQGRPVLGPDGTPLYENDGYREGEAFNRDLQEQRKQERIAERERREQEKHAAAKAAAKAKRKAERASKRAVKKAKLKAEQKLKADKKAAKRAEREAAAAAEQRAKDDAEAAARAERAAAAAEAARARVLQEQAARDAQGRRGAEQGDRARQEARGRARPEPVRRSERYRPAEDRRRGRSASSSSVSGSGSSSSSSDLSSSGSSSSDSEPLPQPPTTSRRLASVVMPVSAVPGPRDGAPAADEAQVAAAAPAQEPAPTRKRGRSPSRDRGHRQEEPPRQARRREHSPPRQRDHERREHDRRDYDSSRPDRREDDYRRRAGTDRQHEPSSSRYSREAAHRSGRDERDHGSGRRELRRVPEMRHRDSRSPPRRSQADVPAAAAVASNGHRPPREAPRKHDPTPSGSSSSSSGSSGSSSSGSSSSDSSAGWVAYSDQSGALVSNERPRLDRHVAKTKFAEFLATFHEATDNEKSREVFKYSDALLKDSTRLRVDLQDIKMFDVELGNLLEIRPAEYLPLLEQAAVDRLRRLNAAALGEESDQAELHQLQVFLHSRDPVPGPVSIRQLTSECVSRLVMIPGIVTAAAKLKHKATHVTLLCKSCKNTKVLACKPGIGGVHVPRTCDMATVAGGANDCGQDPWVVLPSKSKYVDQQSLKLQECPEDVPTGELPRSMSLLVDRHLVGKIVPGTRITAVGIYSIIQGTEKTKEGRGSVAIKQPYLRVVGVEEDIEGDAHNSPTFTVEEEQEFKAFAARPDVHARIAGMIAPQIFGHAEIKRAVACLLFGGARKKLPDGTHRRGDINVLLMGDPSTAKSQFLKFASKTAPIAVYTSGKGSSAAGLTATVIKDAAGEFYLEGGAMVLADNGVVCIDEFDKMRPEDRVAIHEAMEQQTISIAKAGITTMLKSRTSVLAAANPPSGRYDDLKSAQDNIDLQTTILSRFDLIFIVRDERSADRDKQIARHVLDVHRAAGAQGDDGEQARQEEAFLRRYLEYTRTRCSPRLTDSAAELLENEYVAIRREVRNAMHGNGEMPAVPITVRQLEAVVRISESLARMQLQIQVTQAHVAQALDLFKASTMDAVRSGVTDTLVFTEEQRAELHGVEAQVKRRVAIGSYVSERRLVDELVRIGLNESLVRRALHFMHSTGDIEYRKERRLVHRVC